MKMTDLKGLNELIFHNFTFSRCERPPSKELIKMFIRSSAWRGGYQFNSPWVVNDDLVKQYALPSKFADLFVSPAKVCINPESAKLKNLLFIYLKFVFCYHNPQLQVSKIPHFYSILDQTFENLDVQTHISLAITVIGTVKNTN